MKTLLWLGIAALAMMLCLNACAYAGGWSSVHRYVHATGKCSGMREVLSSVYWDGTHTASGERFHPDGMTGASRIYALGTVITARNPHNGRQCRVRMNDRGPFGIAFAVGARIDFSRGSARCLGMSGATYICVP